MKKLILFSAPFGFPALLLLLVLSWFGVYEDQFTEPKQLLFSRVVKGIWLFLWFFSIKREKETRGFYSNHFITSVLVRFIGVLSAVILLSYDLVTIFDKSMSHFGGVISLVVGILAGAISVLLIIVMAEVAVEQVLKGEARGRQRAISNTKAF